MSGWDAAGTKFLSDAGYGNNEAGFWSWFWTDMATTLKDCPNAIFEAWNEPQRRQRHRPHPIRLHDLPTTMYNAIRGTGSTNIIMMQWHMGWFPNGYGNNLSWCKQIDNAIHPTNLVYTTHFYYYAPSDLSHYWATDYATLKITTPNRHKQHGRNSSTGYQRRRLLPQKLTNKQNDYTWWQNLLLAQRDLNIGAGAYYWLSDAGLRRRLRWRNHA